MIIGLKYQNIHILIFILTVLSRYSLKVSSLNSSLKRIYRLNRLNVNEKSGIFEYSGKDPPPELAKLFGIKEKESKPKKSISSTKNKNSKSDVIPTAVSDKKKNKSTLPKVDSVDDLEKDLILKYRSSAYKDLEEEDEWEEDEVAEAKKIPAKSTRNKKFEGFRPESKDKVVDVNPEEVRKNEEDFYKGLKTLSKQPAGESTSTTTKSTPAQVEAPRKSLLLGKLLGRKGVSENVDEVPSSASRRRSPETVEDLFDDYEGVEREVEEEVSNEEASALALKRDRDRTEFRKQQRETEDASRSGPLNAVQGFRLRRPPPISPEQQAVIDATIATQAAKEAAIQDKRKAKKKLDDTNFAAFDFEGEFSSLVTPIEDGSDALFTTKTFANIGVTNAAVLRNLERLRIFNPTNIQELSIPELRQGNNIVMQAQTGSGKTLAYLLPLCDVIDPENKKVQAIILAPSRELVSQIASVGENLFKDTGINIISIIGGANVRNQVARLREDRPQIVVATPGRLAELVFGLKKLRLGSVRALVIDEVDNLLQDPFIGELQMLVEAMSLLNTRRVREGSSSSGAPRTKAGTRRPDEGEGLSRVDFHDGSEEQKNAVDEDDDDDNEFDDDYEDDEEDDEEVADEEEEAVGRNYKKYICLASATGNSAEVRAFADARCGEGAWKLVAARSAAQLPATISHGLVSCARIKALDILRKVLNAQPEVKCALIFVNDPYRVNIICDKLEENGIIAAPLHGDTSKEDRKEILARLRDGRLSLAVTTELAARGLDLPNLTHVINFELPTDAQHYVHRAGRCGRAGRKGLVINFANPDTKFVIRRFGKQLGVHIRDCEIRNGQVFLKGL